MSYQSHSFFRVKTQFENIGDALINRELISLVSEHSQLHMDLSCCPSSFSEVVNAQRDGSIQYRGSLRLFLKMVKLSLCGKRCYFFLNPGGNVGEIGKKEVISRCINIMILILLRLCGVRVCQMGVSYERLGLWSLRVLRWRSCLLYRHFVRDEMSAKYLQKYYVKCHGVVPDLAFNVFQDKYIFSSELNTVCFSFRTDQTQQQIDKIKIFVKGLIERLPVTTDYKFFAQVERDVPNMLKIQGYVEELTGKKYSFQSECIDISKCISFYKTCDLIVSNRLHVLLMGGSVSGRILACTYGHHNTKIEGIFSSLKLDDHIVSIDDEIDQGTWSVILESSLKTFNAKNEKNQLKNSVSEMFSS